MMAVSFGKLSGQFTVAIFSRLSRVLWDSFRVYIASEELKTPGFSLKSGCGMPVDVDWTHRGC